MVDSYEYNYKEDGDILYGEDIRENDAFSIVQSLNYALDGATTTNQDNFDVDLFTSDTAASTTNMQYDAGNDWYEYYQIDDEIDDSDYTDHWTESHSGTGPAISETNDYLEVKTVNTALQTGQQDATSDKSGTEIDYFNSNADVVIKARIELYGNNSASAPSTGATARFGISDGTNTVWLKTQTTTTTATDDSVWWIFIDASANTADIYDDGVLDTADIDISSVNLGNYYIKIEGAANNDTGGGANTCTGRLRLYYLYSLGVGYSNGVVVTDTVTPSASSDVGILKILNTTPAWTSLTNEISFNAGSNYTTAVNKTLVESSNGGTTIQFRFTFAAPTSIVAGTDYFETAHINAYAAYYS